MTLTKPREALEGTALTAGDRDLSVLAGRRILMIAPQPFFANRGTPFNVRAMVRALAERGCEVDLLVFPFGEPVSLPSGVRVLRSPSLPFVRSVPIGPSWTKILLDFPLCFAALRHAITGRYDAFHGVEEGGIVAGVLAMLQRKPYIYDMDSCMPQQLADSGFFKSKLLLKVVAGLENFFIKRAAAVLTVCEALTAKARSIAGNIPIHQIEDCPVDSEPCDQLVAELRLRYGLGGKRVLLYTGNVESYQGIPLLLESFARAAERPDFNDVMLVIVGGGAVSDLPLEACRRLADACGIGDRTVFTGERPPAEMGSFYRLADALASPRLVGGNTPLKIYSYMSAERPIVATDIASHTQVLSGANAFLAAAQASSFSQAIIECFSCPSEVRRAKVENAKLLVDECYSRKAFESRLAALYAELFGGATPR